MDVSPITDAINGAVTAVALIAGAMLLLEIAVRIWDWIGGVVSASDEASRRSDEGL